MRLLKTISAIAIVISMTTATFADDIYLSFSNHGEGAGMAPSNTTMDFDGGTDIGATGSAYIWFQDGFNYTGAFLDAFTSDSSVVALTGFEVFQANTVLGTTPIGLRWDQSSIDANTDGGIMNPVTTSAEEIRGFRGFAVLESGINGDGSILANPNDATNGTGLFTDELFESGNGFLFARIDFQVVGSGTAVISSAAAAGHGSGAPIVGDDPMGNDTTLNPRFSSGVTINVSAIPEPTSATLLAMGLVGLVARRRR